MWVNVLSKEGKNKFKKALQSTQFSTFSLDTDVANSFIKLSFQYKSFVFESGQNLYKNLSLDFAFRSSHGSWCCAVWRN